MSRTVDAPGPYSDDVGPRCTRATRKLNWGGCGPLAPLGLRKIQVVNRVRGVREGKSPPPQGPPFATTHFLPARNKNARFGGPGAFCEIITSSACVSSSGTSSWWKSGDNPEVIQEAQIVREEDRGTWQEHPEPSRRRRHILSPVYNLLYSSTLS